MILSIRLDKNSQDIIEAIQLLCLKIKIVYLFPSQFLGNLDGIYKYIVPVVEPSPLFSGIQMAKACSYLRFINYQSVVCLCRQSLSLFVCPHVKFSR